MSRLNLRASVDTATLAERMHALMRELFPICRSITGDGARRTFARLSREIPLRLHEVPSGAQAFDWTVPREWNIRDAWVKNSAGERVIDFQQHSLHVVNYSTPVRARMPLAELKQHVHTLPEQPDLIPYRTSYYKDYWGFCLSHTALLALEEGDYDVCIDSTLEAGSLTYAECVLPGASDEEVLISTHSCHPSLANDNLSGLIMAMTLAQLLCADSARQLHYTYRFVFAPGTIGSLVWLSRNQDAAQRVKHGLVITGVGDPGALTYKQSRRGDASIDRIVTDVLRASALPHSVQAFSPYGYDERQYCSPGFNLPVGCFSRSTYGSYRQYHTSGDSLEFVQPAYLAESLAVLLAVVDALEAEPQQRDPASVIRSEPAVASHLSGDRVCINQKPFGEPQLGKRGLYGAIGGNSDAQTFQLAMLWVLNQSDGGPSLSQIAERAGMPFDLINAAADALLKTDLLRSSA